MDHRNVLAVIPPSVFSEACQQSKLRPCAPLPNGDTPWRFEDYFGVFLIKRKSHHIFLVFDRSLSTEEQSILQQRFGITFSPP